MEIIIVFIYALVILAIANAIQSSNLAKGRKEYRFFFNGLLLKLVGAIAYGLIYKLVYKYGDTIQYYRCGIAFYQFSQEHFNEWLKLMFSSAEFLDKSHYEANSGYSIYTTVSGLHPFYIEPDMFLMGKIISILAGPALGSYFVLSLFYAVLSFTGIWKLFQTITQLFPNYENHLGYSIFFIPSVCFFGSGLMKDSLTIGALGWFFYSASSLLTFSGKNLISKIVWLLISSYFLLILKAYILMCFVISLMVWLALRYNSGIKNILRRVVFFPIIVAFMAFATSYGLVYIANQTEKYRIDNIKSTAQGYQNYHLSITGEEGGGSSYSLGDLDYSTTGVLKKVPAAINVTFFRPYLWEAHSILMGFSAIENLIILLLTIYIIFIKVKLGTFLSIIRKDQLVILSFVFALTLGFAVGFTTYNFGALARYKIPALLFYNIGMSLVFTRYHERLFYRHVKLN